MIRMLVVAAIVLLIIAPVHAYTPGFSDVPLSVAGIDVPYSPFFATVMPGDSLKIELRVDPAQSRQMHWSASFGHVTTIDGRIYQWKAPAKPGTVLLKLENEDGNVTNELVVFVLTPRTWKQGEYLNGYRIGNYPEFPLKGLSIYRQPSGFIEVNKENHETKISPHFTLGQFLCKQESGWPKYLVLRPQLLLKLEMILQELNSTGHSYESIEIMSGYRTPYYNAAIGNVKYSRHIWGGAADIYLDEFPRDGTMDDLNQDAVSDYRDAGVMYNLIDRLFGKPIYSHLIGGLGRYRKNASHGPFVHIDVRGSRARWGK